MRPCLSAAAMLDVGISTKCTVVESPPFLSIHCSAPSCSVPPSVVTAMILPLRSAPVFSLDPRTFISCASASSVDVRLAAVSTTIGMPRWIAATAEVMFEKPASSEPPAIAAMIAPPPLKLVTVASSPYFLKMPVCCA